MKLAWVMLAFGWATNLYFHDLDWLSVALGAFTGLVVTAWAIEITGNKIPESWRPKSPSKPPDAL